MHEEIRHLLSNLDNELTPLRQVAEELLDEDSLLDPATGAALISRRIKVAPEAFACVVYPGMPAEGIARYEGIHNLASGARITIPDAYKAIVTRLNGAEVLELSLYGLPPSMCNNPPLLSRSMRQPLDLATANNDWNRSFKPDEAQFHFGGSPYSWEENLGYFLNPDASVEAVLKGGVRVNQWPTFEAFLNDELSRLAKLFPAFEERWFESRQSLKTETKNRKQKP
jgi:hypothetical protein